MNYVISVGTVERNYTSKTVEPDSIGKRSHRQCRNKRQSPSWGKAAPSTINALTVVPSGYFKDVLQEILVIKAVVNKVGETYLSNGIYVLLADVESQCSFVELELRTSLDPQQEEMSLLRLMKLGELLGLGRLINTHAR